MRIIFPSAIAANHYCENCDEAVQIASMTIKGTVEGWSGIGLIEKQAPNHWVSLEEIMTLTPSAAPSWLSVHRRSIFSRALREASDLLP